MQAAHFSLVPVQYSLGMLPIISEYDWKANALHLGIVFKYAPKPSALAPPSIPETPKVETPVIAGKSRHHPSSKENRINGGCICCGIDANNAEQPR